MSRANFGFCLLSLACLFSASAFCSEVDSRLEHKYGLYAGFIGDPFPTLVGVNLGVNVFDFMRVVAGYGSISATVSDGIGPGTSLTATTLGGGLRFFVPHWSFSPVVGASYANVSVSGSNSGDSTTVGGFSSSGSHTYLTAGIDWQTHYGLDLGVGYNYSLLSGVGGLPFINLGWFF